MTTVSQKAIHQQGHVKHPYHQRHAQPKSSNERVFRFSKVSKYMMYFTSTITLKPNEGRLGMVNLTFKESETMPDKLFHSLNKVNYERTENTVDVDSNITHVMVLANVCKPGAPFGMQFLMNKNVKPLTVCLILTNYSPSIIISVSTAQSKREEQHYSMNEMLNKKRVREGQNQLIL